MILGLLAPRDFGWIKIRRIVFVQHFSFSHPACLSLTNPTSKTRTAMHLLLLLRLLLLLLLLVCFRALKAKFLLSHKTLIKHHPHAKWASTHHQWWVFAAFSIAKSEET
jgi:hypothetical protein